MTGTIVKTRDGRELVMPSDEENARIHAAALADPDAQPWTDEQLEAARPSMRFGYKRKDAPKRDSFTHPSFPRKRESGLV